MTQLPLRKVGLIERIKVRVLSRLLWLANGDIGRGIFDYQDWAKSRFYRLIKDPILTRYSTVLGGMDIQRIVHKCRACGGTGQWGRYRSDGGSTCYRCNGTGVYRTDHFGLARFDLGGRKFHKPVLKWIGAMPPDDMPVTIEGRIIHVFRGVRGTEALLWLALIYDRALFRFLMSPRHFITAKFTPCPLVAIQTTLRLWASPHDRIRGLLSRVRSWIPRRCGVCGTFIPGSRYACDTCVPF